MENNLNEIISTLGIKIANLEIQNAQLLVENNALKEQLDKENEKSNK